MSREAAETPSGTRCSPSLPTSTRIPWGPEHVREAFDLDSIDFLAFVERLTDRTGHRIEEDDYDKLSTLESAVDLLVNRA